MREWSCYSHVLADSHRIAAHAPQVARERSRITSARMAKEKQLLANEEEAAIVEDSVKAAVKEADCTKER